MTQRVTLCCCRYTEKPTANRKRHTANRHHTPRRQASEQTNQRYSNNQPTQKTATQQTTGTPKKLFLIIKGVSRASPFWGAYAPLTPLFLYNQNFLGVFLMLFVRFCSFSFRWWSGCSLPPVVALSVALLLCPLWLVGFVLRSALFVRFPAPSFVPSGCLALRRWCRVLGLPCGWRCVPASALSSVRSSCFVWAVRPAVLRRRSGVVLFFWVWVSPTAEEQINP